MNFFGHAALADWKHPDAGFVLGSMVPDFAGMLRARVPRTSATASQRGIDFHHASDHVFHELLDFRELLQDGVRWLCERDMRRGPARAAAHVGVELLLDACWASDERSRSAYVKALESAGSGALIWQGSEDGARFEALCLALLARQQPEHWADSTLIAERLGRALSGRPRLELQPDERAVARDWVVQAQPTVAARAPAVLAALRAALADFSVAA